MRKSLFLALGLLYLFSCQNRDINEGEEFRPRQVRDNFQGVIFSKVNVDGIEYLMLERDNNNPHEGFGFMAFRANMLMEKQDSVIAYLKTISKMQSKIYSRIFNTSMLESDSIYASIFNSYLAGEQVDLNRLQTEMLKDTTTVAFR